MESIARQAHVRRTFGSVERGQQDTEPGRVLRVDSSRIAVFEKTIQSLVAYPFIICNLSLITYHLSLIKIFARIFAARLSRFWLLPAPACGIANIPDGIHSRAIFPPEVGAGTSEAVLADPALFAQKVFSRPGAFDFLELGYVWHFSGIRRLRSMIMGEAWRRVRNNYP